MNIQSERTSREKHTGFQAEAAPLASNSLLRLRYWTKRAWPTIWPCLQTSSFAPHWLPERWRQPLTGYLVAVPIEMMAVGATLLMAPHFPIFALQGALVILGIVVVALNWGGGPSLLATLVGTVLTGAFVEPLYLDRFIGGVPKGVCVVLFLLIGFSISLIASQSGWARWKAQELALSLREEQARTEQGRLRLRTLLDVLPAAVGMMDTQACILENNPASKTLWGEGAPRPGDIVQPQAWRGWWPDTGQPLAPDEWAITRALTSGETIINQEVAVETAPGQHKVVLESAAPIRDESGTIVGAADIHQDITGRKRLEDALRQAEREAAAHASELEAIFEAMTDALLVYDADGRILRCNTTARQLLGFEAQPDAASLPFLARAPRYLPLDERGQPLPIEQLALSRMLRGEIFSSAHADDEYLHTLDGRELAVSITGQPLHNADGAISGAVAIVRDVTGRRQLEQHTRDTLNALLAMAEELVQAPDKVTAAGEYTSPGANQVARRLAELTRSILGCKYVGIAAVEPATRALTPITIVGLSAEQEQQWWAGWDEDSRLGQHLPPNAVAALRAGEPVLLDSLPASLLIWQHPAPTRKSVLVPMRVAETLVGILRIDCGGKGEDFACPKRQALIKAVARLGALVLERERLLRERAEAQASELALREATQQMDTFLGMAGHELKTPLTSIKLSLQLAERRIGRLIQREPDAANELAPLLDQSVRAGRQAERLDRLVNDLVDVSRVRAGRLELHPEPADLASIVRETVEEERQAAPARTLILHLPADLRVPVAADAARIGQVVTNYLTNALKYSTEDRPVEIGIVTENQQARVWVRDQGPGLPAEEQERIWERFHRVKGIEVQSGTGIGLGLGLHICRTIIERHQGQVGVESAPGQGSTFWFTLPLDSQDHVKVVSGTEPGE